MKFILVISFLVSLLLSDETRLIIGCFKEPKNAENAKIKIDKYVQSNTKFKNFLEENSVTTKYTVIGDWNVISFEPFNDNQVLYHTYFKIKDMYPDSYKIDMGAKGDQEIMASYSKNEMPSAKDEIKEPLSSKNEKIMTFQDEMKQDTTPETAKSETTEPVQDEKVQKQEMTEVTRDTLPNTKKSEEADSDVPYLYPLLAVVLIIVILIIYFTQRQPKKTLHTLKEDFEEDLS